MKNIILKQKSQDGMNSRLDPIEDIVRELENWKINLKILPIIQYRLKHRNYKKG